VLALALTEGAVLLGVLTLLPPAVEDAGASATTAGLVTAVYGVAVLGCAQVVGRLSRRVPAAALIGTGGTAAVLGCLVGSVSRGVAGGLAVAVLLGLAWAAMHSSLQTWATEVVPEARATAVSLFAGSLFVGSALAALAVGGLAEAGRYALVFALAALLAVPLAVVGARARRRWSPA
jgi:MFS family permease